MVVFVWCCFVWCLPCIVTIIGKIVLSLTRYMQRETSLLWLRFETGTVQQTFHMPTHYCESRCMYVCMCVLVSIQHYFNTASKFHDMILYLETIDISKFSSRTVSNCSITVTVI